MSDNEFNQSHFYEYEHHIKLETHKYIKKIKNELYEKSWHPDRFINWCLDDIEKKEILNRFDRNL